MGFPNRRTTFASAMTHKTSTTKAPPNIPASLMKPMRNAHMFINRVSGGRFGNSMRGDEVCFVTMTGAKSGKQLTRPLMYVPYGSGVLLVASMGGAPKNPVWYQNVVEQPNIDVRHRDRKMKLTARPATEEEKPSLWPICDAAYAPFAVYRANTSRDIPIFVCEERIE